MKSIEIKNKLANGEINTEQAAVMFQELHGNEGNIVAFKPRKDGGFSAIARYVKDQKNYVFNHQMAYDHYLDRKDLEEGIKHTIGLVAFGATGLIDGTVEGCIYLASELVESASFAISRTINRTKSGWVRGWNDEG